MRAGRVPVAPYTRPGSADLFALIAELAADHPAILLANHGPVVAGPSLAATVFAVEEIEEAAKLSILLRGMNVRLLTRDQIDDLNRTFNLR